MSAHCPSTRTGKDDIKNLARSFFVLPGRERFTRGIAPWNRQRQDGNPSHRLRLIPRNDWRRAMNSRTSGRKNALLKRPIGGSGSR